MVALTSLWLPVLVAAVLVFIASSIIHMVLGYHNTDYGKLPKEDDVTAALRPAEARNRAEPARAITALGDLDVGPWG